MKDKCPFCGAEDKSYSSNPKDHCHWVGKYAKDLAGVRSSYCYERQIANLTQVQAFLANVAKENQDADK